MGAAIARNLIRAGHKLTVYNRSKERMTALAAEGAPVALADSAGAAARQAEVVLTMLADDRAVEATVLGDGGVLGTLPAGAVHVSLPTISVALSERLTREHAQRGQHFVSAPVFGRPDAAAAAKLVVVVAGPSVAVERCLPLFSAIGQATHRLGEEPPRANLVKLSGNFLIATLIEALGETYALTRKAGIAPGDFHAVLKSLIGGAPIFARYAGLIADSAFEPAGFELYLGLKDLRLLLQASEAAAVPMPLSGPIRDSFLHGISHGLGHADWSSVALCSAERAGLSGQDPRAKP
jgi:3-hydroxyisobutyrate dehydrogenase-like beta-hydroxyacid dehydrogenase